MKSSTLMKSIGASALALGLLVAPLTLPASAQVGTGAEPEGIIYRTEDDDFDWGWLGLLGLIGLAGLAGGKKREEPTAYREPTSTRY
jgi:hypothetical protein